MVKAKAVKQKKTEEGKVSRFIVNKNNTVEDQKTGLIIIQDPTLLGDAFKSTITFDAAVKAIQDLNKQGYAGYNDWRLPSVEELCGMVDRTKQDPCYDTNIFKGKFNNWYWSGETCAWNPTGAAWCVNSNGGDVYGGSRGYGNYVRPVRSSQCQFDPLLVR